MNLIFLTHKWNLKYLNSQIMNSFLSDYYNKHNMGLWISIFTINWKHNLCPTERWPSVLYASILSGSLYLKRFSLVDDGCNPGSLSSASSDGASCFFPAISLPGLASVRLNIQDCAFSQLRCTTYFSQWDLKFRTSTLHPGRRSSPYVLWS